MPRAASSARPTAVPCASAPVRCDAKDVTGCVRLDESVLGAMEAYNGLAPAHNPPYITGIRLFGKRMPGVPLVGLFETAFYQFAPEAMMRYAVPEAWHDIGVRRWGFHGASHKFIAERSAELLDRKDVDAVYIPLPNSLHVTWTIAAASTAFCSRQRPKTSPIAPRKSAAI